MRISLLGLLFLSSCSIFFGSPDGPKSAKTKHYEVKYSSPGWIYKKDNRSDYVFENQSTGHIMLSNSFCEEFQEDPLEKLAEKTFRTIAQFKVKLSKYKTFHDREAYHLEGQGQVDGVPVALRMLNTRRNNCYFDFVSIGPNESVRNRDKDFEAFLNAVVFK